MRDDRDVFCNQTVRFFFFVVFVSGVHRERLGRRIEPADSRRRSGRRSGSRSGESSFGLHAVLAGCRRSVDRSTCLALAPRSNSTPLSTPLRISAPPRSRQPLAPRRSALSGRRAIFIGGCAEDSPKTGRSTRTATCSARFGTDSEGPTRRDRLGDADDDRGTIAGFVGVRRAASGAIAAWKVCMASAGGALLLR